jgi:alpha-mannosidase
MRQLLTIFFASLVIPALTQSFIPGYHSKIAGEDLNYHAPQPDATVSLLVRSEDSKRYIEWESAPLISSSPGLQVSPFPLLFLAGIDVNPLDPHHWNVIVNDREMFTISSPTDTVQKTLTWPGPDGSSLVFKAKEVDKYGDFMGYLYCNLPASMLEAGKPVRFKVVGESAGSRTWFMVFKYETTDQVRLVPEQAVMRGEKGNYQVLRAEIVRYADPVDAKISVAGYNVFYLPVPQINQETSFDFVVKAGKIILADQSFQIQPVTPRTIYLLHHSHNDIGYTHLQNEVEDIQWKNLEKALALSDSTKAYPAGAQFKWCTEVMWAVESWYDKANPEQKQVFKEAVKLGRIELNGLFANELISLCGPEELDRLLEAGRRISRECGAELNSAMITDIPGWSWALVPALANSGVKYLSLGTNRGHRIGDIIKEWGDKPFYWVSPSGEEKVLCWVHGEGYSLFHTGLAYSSIRKRLQEDIVFGYLKKLSEENYPYEEVMLRYNIGSDNGPVDETLPQAVKEWNEKYVTPKIIISTVGEAFSAFEKKHGSELPQVAGDITCYWEDGAYSTARETIRNRRNASRLVQAQALWAMYNPAGYPEKNIREAWRNVLLFDEHTWGSWNSISEPEVPFTLQQWEIKKSFAADAEKQSKKLFFDAMTSKILGGPAADAVEVINTCGWTRSGLVTVSGGAQPQEIVLSDEAGNAIPTQLLSDGNIAFLAKNVPALGSKIYKITNQPSNRPIAQSPNRQTVQSSNRQIETESFKLSIDQQTGAVSSLNWKKAGTPSRGMESPGMESLLELVDTSKFSGLNEYLYVEGRMPDHPLKAKLLNVSMIENGPLLFVIKLEAEAPGSKSLTTYIRIIDELNLVELINTLDRNKVYTPEAVHIAFPFHLPGGTMRYDLAYGYCRPQTDQVPGSNMNFLAMEHWLDISDKNNGVTVICPDAPLFESGNITMDEVVYGWLDSISPSQTFLSYVMNNYWETNYAASQEGTCTFRYIIMPHEGFDPSVAEKEAIGQRQPLLTRKGGGWQKARESLLQLQNDNLIITDLKPVGNGKKLLVTVYNAGNKEEIPAWENTVKQVVLSDPDGLTENKTDMGKAIPPGGIRYFKITSE